MESDSRRRPIFLFGERGLENLGLSGWAGNAPETVPIIRRNGREKKDLPFDKESRGTESRRKEAHGREGAEGPRLAASGSDVR